MPVSRQMLLMVMAGLLSVCQVRAASVAAMQLDLTPAEQHWLVDHPHIRFSDEGNWPPVAYTAPNGEHAGLVSDYLRLVAERLGVSFDYVPSKNWAEALEKARRKAVDILPELVKTPERSAYLDFTDAYLHLPMVIFGRDDLQHVDALSGLAGLKVAVEKGYMLEQLYASRYPAIRVVTFDTTEQCLRALSDRRVDAYVGVLPVTRYLISQLSLPDIHVIALTDQGFDLAMGVRKDWPLLVPILQKALDSITEQEKLALRRRWLVEERRQAIPSWAWQLAAGLLVLLLAVLVWNLQVRRQHEALRRSEARFNQAMEATSEGVWEWNPETGERFFNAGFFHRLGYSDEEIPTCEAEWAELIHPDDRAERLTTFKAFEQNRTDEEQPLRLDYRIRKKNGDYIHVRTEGRTIQRDASGRAIRRMGTLRDITLIKAAEEALRKSEQQLRTMLDAIPVAIVVSAMDGEIIAANPHAAAEVGSAEPSIVGRNMQEFYAEPADRDKVFDLLRTEGRIQKLPIRFRTDQGEVVEGLISVLPIHFGDQMANLGVLINMTERLQMERQLAEARDAAEEASRFKSRFLANMSHEIRTPMNAIIGLSYLLSKTQLDDTQRDYLNKLDYSGKLLLEIINDILDFSKIEAGHLSIESICFRLDEVLENVVHLMSVRAQEKGLALVLQQADGVPTELIGDPLRLGQVLLNLVGNAVKFTEAGQVVVEVSPIHRQEERAWLQFAVVDSGPGIASDKLAGLFDAFSQVDTSTSREYGGTGLGLAICQQLVALMGGEIRVESTPGEGSRFTFFLPFAEEDASALSATRQLCEDAADASCCQLVGEVLLIEDNEINQQVAQALLASFGLTVQVTSDGASALEQLAARTFDLVLMDVQMPGMDGCEATRQIRQRAALADLPVIAMTAQALGGEREACLAAGMNDYLTKPIDPDKLFDTLARWLAKKDDATTVETVAMDPQWLQAQLPGVDVVQGVQRVGGNQALYQRLLTNFCRDHAASALQVEQAMAASDTATARRIVHTVRGVAANLGLQPLASAAASLEQGLRRDDRDDNAALLETFANCLQDCMAIPGRLAGHPAGAAANQRTTTIDLPQQLALLRARLERGEPAAAESVQLLAGSMPEELFQRLQRYTENYDFDDALAVLAKWRGERQT